MRLAGTALFASPTAALLLAGCTPAPEEESPGEQEAGQFETGSYEVDPETGETRAVVNNEDGTTTMRAGETVVPRLPEASASIRVPKSATPSRSAATMRPG